MDELTSLTPIPLRRCVARPSFMGLDFNWLYERGSNSALHGECYQSHFYGPDWAQVVELLTEEYQQDYVRHVFHQGPWFIRMALFYRPRLHPWAQYLALREAHQLHQQRKRIRSVLGAIQQGRERWCQERFPADLARLIVSFLHGDDSSRRGGKKRHRGSTD